MHLALVVQLINLSNYLFVNVIVTSLLKNLKHAIYRQVTKASVELTELSLGKVVDNCVVMVKKQLQVSLLADNQVLVAVIDEDVVYVVKIDPVSVYVRQAEQE